MHRVCFASLSYFFFSFFLKRNFFRFKLWATERFVVGGRKISEVVQNLFRCVRWDEKKKRSWLIVFWKDKTREEIILEVCRSKTFFAFNAKRVNKYLKSGRVCQQTFNWSFSIRKRRNAFRCQSRALEQNNEKYKNFTLHNTRVNCIISFKKFIFYVFWFILFLCAAVYVCELRENAKT